MPRKTLQTIQPNPKIYADHLYCWEQINWREGKRIEGIGGVEERYF